MNRNRTEIYSIFGQIEGVVALSMVDAGRVHKIEPDMIPATARYDDEGRCALFAIVIPKQLMREFDQRVAELRR